MEIFRHLSGSRCYGAGRRVDVHPIRPPPLCGAFAAPNCVYTRTQWTACTAVDVVCRGDEGRARGKEKKWPSIPDCAPRGGRSVREKRIPRLNGRRGVQRRGRTDAPSDARILCVPSHPVDGVCRTHFGSSKK